MQRPACRNVSRFWSFNTRFLETASPSSWRHLQLAEIKIFLAPPARRAWQCLLFLETNHEPRKTVDSVATSLRESYAQTVKTNVEITKHLPRAIDASAQMFEATPGEPHTRRQV